MPHLSLARKGGKFHPDGSLRRFPGCTVISFIPPESELFSALVRVQEQFKVLPSSSCWVFLPPDSFHMTVMDLACDEIRTTEKWTYFLPLDVSLTALDAFLRERVTQIPAPDGFDMQIEKIYTGITLAVDLLPTETSALALKNYRNSLSEITGIRFPGHDDYFFHITLAYNIRELDVTAKTETTQRAQACAGHLRQNFPLVKIGKPQFVLFNDMFHYYPTLER